MEPKGSLRDRLSGLVEQKTTALRDSLKARVASWKGNGTQTSVVGAVAGTEEVPDVITLQIGQKSLPGVGVELRTELWLSALHRRDGAGGKGGARMIDSFPELSTKELPQEVVSDIDKDVKRTFPQYALYNTAEGQQQLRTILHAYAAYDPEVGYCQGMNFLAGILMLFLNTEAEAFAALVLLMQERKLRTFYIRSMALLQVQLWQLGKLMSPKLCTHLESCGVVPMLYGAPWLMTGFSADFPVSFSARIMDVMLSDRCHCALLKVAVSILKRCEAVLHQMSDLEAILKYLKVEVPRWSEEDLSDVLVDAFAKPWTTRQKTILSNTEDVETVAQGMERVMDLQEQLSRGPGQAEEDEEEDSSAGVGNGPGSMRCESSDASARGGASRSAPFSEPGGYCVPILAPPPSTSAPLCHLGASNPPSNASSNPSSPAVGAGARGLDRSVDAASTLYSVPEGHPASCAPPATQLQMGSMPLPACSGTLAHEPQLTARQMRMPAQALSKSLPCALLSSTELQEPNALVQMQQQQQQAARGALYSSSGEAAGLAGDEARGDAMHDGGTSSEVQQQQQQQQQQDSQGEHLDSPAGTPKGGYYPPLGAQSPFARSVGTAHAVLAAAAVPPLTIPEPSDISQRPSAAASAYASPRGVCPAGEGWDGQAPAPPAAAAAGWQAACASPAGASSHSGSASLPIVIQSRRSYGPPAGSAGGGLGDGELLSPRSPHPPAPRPAADRPSDNAPYHEPDGFDELASSGSYSTKLLQELRRDLSLNLNLSGSNLNGAAALNFSGYRGLSALDTSCLGSPNSMLSLTTAQSPGSTYPCPTPVPPAYTSAGCNRQDLSVGGDAPGPRQCQGEVGVEVGRLSGASSCASAARPYAPAAAAAAAAAALLPPLDAPILLVRSSSNRGAVQAAREECHRLFESLPRSRGSGPLPAACDEAGDIAGDILRAFVACGTARKGAMYDPQERLAEAMYADSPQKEEHKFFGDVESPSPSCARQSPEAQQEEQAGAVAALEAGLPEAESPPAPPAPLCGQPAPLPPVLTRQPSASMGSVGGVAIFDPKHMCGHDSSVRLSGGGAPAASVPGPAHASRRASADVWMKSSSDGYGNTVPGASSHSVNMPAGSGVDGMWGVGASNWGAAASNCHSPHTPLVARMELLHGTSMLELAHAAVAMQAAMDAAQQQAQEQANVADTILPSGDAACVPLDGLASPTVDAGGHRPPGDVVLEASMSSPSSSESPELLPAPWCPQGDGCMSAEEQERSAVLHTVVTAGLPDLCPAALQAALHASWVSGLGGGGGGGSGPGSPHTPLVAKMELPRGTSMLAVAQAAAAVQAALEAGGYGLPHVRNLARMVLEPREPKCPPPSGLVSHAGTDRTNSFISTRASLDLDTPAGVLQLDLAEHGHL